MEKTTAERLVYSIPEAAHALHCSKSLVYDLVKADKLPQRMPSTAARAWCMTW